MNRRRWTFGAALTLCAAMATASCATNEASSSNAGAADAQTLPSEDAAAPDGDAAPCSSDCEFFPATCSAGVLCPDDLFDPAHPSGDEAHLDARTRLHLIRGRSATDVWVLGALGAIAHFDGSQWRRSQVPPGTDSPRGRSPTIQSIFLHDGYEIGVVGLDLLCTRGLEAPSESDASVDDWIDRGPASLTYPPEFGPTEQLVTAAWSLSGAHWKWLATSATWNPTSPGGLVRVRLNTARAFEGEVPKTRFGRLFALHGATADDLWAVGTNGAALRIQGAEGDAPTFEEYNTQTRNALYGVWAASPSDVWAVGFGGTIRHYSGGPLLWDQVSDVPAGSQLNAIWGSSPSDIWAVGNDAVVLHYDGKSWARVEVGGLGGRRPDLTTVWTPGPGRVWIGGDGVLLSVRGDS